MGRKGIFVILTLPDFLDLYQATLHLRSSFWDKIETTKVPGYEALIMELIRMNRDILLQYISAKIQQIINPPPKVAGQSNQARMYWLSN